jgi:hypothetical protein
MLCPPETNAITISASTRSQIAADRVSDIGCHPSIVKLLQGESQPRERVSSPAREPAFFLRYGLIKDRKSLNQQPRTFDAVELQDGIADAVAHNLHDECYHRGARSKESPPGTR